MISQEIADIAIYLFLLADATGIDLGPAIRSKLVVNAQKYPVDRDSCLPDRSFTRLTRAFAPAKTAS